MRKSIFLPLIRAGLVTSLCATFVRVRNSVRVRVRHRVRNRVRVRVRYSVRVKDGVRVRNSVRVRVSMLVRVSFRVSVKDRVRVEGNMSLYYHATSGSIVHNAIVYISCGIHKMDELDEIDR